MTELKLGEIKGLLGEKTPVSKYDHYCNNEICGACHDEDINKHIDELGNKNLLDYVEVVVCSTCEGRKSILTKDAKWGWEKAFNQVCFACNGTGAVIRVKEGK